MSLESKKKFEDAAEQLNQTLQKVYPIVEDKNERLIAYIKENARSACLEDREYSVVKQNILPAEGYVETACQHIKDVLQKAEDEVGHAFYGRLRPEQIVQLYKWREDCKEAVRKAVVAADQKWNKPEAVKARHDAIAYMQEKIKTLRKSRDEK